MTIPAKSSDPWSNNNDYAYGTVSQQDNKQPPKAETPPYEEEAPKKGSKNCCNNCWNYLGYGVIGLAVVAFVASLIWNAVSPAAQKMTSSNSTVVVPSINHPVQSPSTATSSSSKMIASLNMPQQGPLMDLIHAIDDDTASKILAEIAAVEQDVPGCEIQVLLANYIENGWSSPKQFATSLFNMWELGDKRTNNGVLILFLLDIRRIEVEVGKNLDVYMDHTWTEDMLYRDAVPEFKKGNYGVGILNVVESVTDRLRDIENGQAQAYTTDNTIINIIFGSFIGSILCCICFRRWWESKYPMGSNKFCQSCGVCDWTHQRWDEIRRATYHESGLRRRYCICNRCQNVETIDVAVSSGRETDYGGGGGGGSSDGGGGGGASW